MIFKTLRRGEEESKGYLEEKSSKIIINWPSLCISGRKLEEEGERKFFGVVYNGVSSSMCDRNELKLYFMYVKVCFVFISRYWIAVKRNANVWCGY